MFCDICPPSVYFSTSQEMKEHYFSHYSEDLQSFLVEFANLDQCKICFKVFKEEKDILFHIGIDHEIINDIRWNKNQSVVNFKDELDEAIEMNENITDKSDKNLDNVHCDYCQAVFDNCVDLLICYSRHFEEDLVTLCDRLLGQNRNVSTQTAQLLSSMKNIQSSRQYQCPICTNCGGTFSNFNALSVHIGGVHMLVNDILQREGIKPILPQPEDFQLYFDNLDFK